MFEPHLLKQAQRRGRMRHREHVEGPYQFEKMHSNEF
jgi:hypothetical protein